VPECKDGPPALRATLLPLASLAGQDKEREKPLRRATFVRDEAG